MLHLNGSAPSLPGRLQAHVKTVFLRFPVTVPAMYPSLAEYLLVLEPHIPKYSTTEIIVSGQPKKFHPQYIYISYLVCYWMVKHWFMNKLIWNYS